VALKIELKPNERVIVGNCVVTNVDHRTRLLIEGTVPILREKDIMSLSRANSPAKRIYLAIQLMYTANARRTITRCTFGWCATSFAPHRAPAALLTASTIKS
jgi:flagellar biosynthesis repressor protein FlbT